MEAKDRLHSLFLSYLSRPATDRPLYRAIAQYRVHRIIELGVGTGQRAVRMIQLAALFHPPASVEYVGLDLFESRSAGDGPGMSLKMAYCLLGQTGARIRLIPGDLRLGLSRTANALGQFDLAVFSARQDPQAWFYLPRLLKDQTRVFLEQIAPGGKVSIRPVAADEIRALATASVLRRAA